MIGQHTASQDESPTIARLLPAATVASILGVSPKTVHKLVREEKLACVQVTAQDRRLEEEPALETEAEPGALILRARNRREQLKRDA